MAPEIDGKLYLNDIQVPESDMTARPGDIVTVEITETHEYDLVGRVVEILDVPRPVARDAIATGPVQRVVTGAALRILA
jgi:ribosomal protein S12 methylthiotransferase